VKTGTGYPQAEEFSRNLPYITQAFCVKKEGTICRK
jgi:hypothetical protein